MENLKEQGLFLVKTGFIVIRKIILYSALGFFLNILFLILLYPEMETIGESVVMHPHEVVGAIIALGAIVIANLPIVGMLLTFGVIFPVLYFISGKKSGVEGAIHKIINEKQSSFTVYAGKKMAEFILANQKWKEKIKQVGLQNFVIDFFKSGSKKISALPRAVRWIVQLLLKKTEKAATYGQQVESHFQGTTPENLPEKISSFLSQLINGYLEDKKSNSLKWILSVNVALFALLKILI
jgi:hypothetical protein